MSFSEIKTDDSHAEELAVLTHEGREYASGGFYVDVDSGHMIAYVEKGGFDWDRDRFVLTTWNGQKLARLFRSGRSRGFNCFLEHFRTVDPIAGYHWYGKGLGAGMMLRLRRGRKAVSK